LISEWSYNWLSRVRQRTIVATALIFDLIIFIINLIGLRIFNDVLTVEDLLTILNACILPLNTEFLVP